MRSTVHGALALGAWLLGAPALAQDAGVPDAGVSLEEIEKALAADAPPPPAPSLPQAIGAVVQSLNPDLSLIADVALAAMPGGERFGAGAHDPARTGFNLQQLELAASAAVDPFFRFNANLVFSKFGVEIEEAYATSTSLPFRLQLRAGQFLTRFGRQNSTHLHAWTFSDAAFALARVFGAEGNRGVGAELSYLAPLPWYVEAVASLTEADGEASARSFMGARELPVRGPADLQLTTALKQFHELSDAWSLAWGLSWASGPASTGYRNRTEVYGADLYLKFRPLGDDPTVVALQLETLHRRRQVPHGVLTDWGGYAQLSWRWTLPWSVAGRYELGTPEIGGAGALDPQWVSARQRVSAAVTYEPTEFSRVRLQAASDFLGWETRPRLSAFLMFEVSVGAHGAHPF
jgi:hypothetical protein